MSSPAATKTVAGPISVEADQIDERPSSSCARMAAAAAMDAPQLFSSLSHHSLRATSFLFM